jgi:polyhydroxyalkanoate synthesis regulator phasin
MELVTINKNEVLTDRVNKGMAEVDAQTRVFDRNNSQSTLTLCSLTMLNGQSPMRMIRQSLAEIEKRKNALYEAQYNLAKKKKKLDETMRKAKTDDCPVLQSQIIMLQHQVATIENKANGSLKDIAILMDAYEHIKANNNIDSWSEKDYEQAEKEHHVRRGFELMYKNLIEGGRARDSTIEYLHQHGVHTQYAVAEVSGYINLVNAMVKDGKKIDSSHFEDFLDEMKKKYANCVDVASERIFGVKDLTNKEYMTQIIHKENKNGS